MISDVSVCIATFRRPERLRLLLDDLAAQRNLPCEVVVVDNDAAGSARVPVATFRGHASFPVSYAIEPVRGIARARNRLVQLARGEWLAFLDDDERVPVDWLAQMTCAAQKSGADGILGPVIAQLPDDSPRWLYAGKFYDFPRRATGATVPRNWLRFGNVLLRGTRVRAEPGPFDERYGLATGEDGDLLLRLIDHGARIEWCDEAVVYEPIERARMSMHWLLQRSYSRGQEFGRKTLQHRYGPRRGLSRPLFLAAALIKMVIATVLAVGTAPFARHRGARWLMRSAANLGKLTAFLNWRYCEYLSASASPSARGERPAYTRPPP
jgi:succinoglycan biosynthesis protein ExoM